MGGESLFLPKLSAVMLASYSYCGSYKLHFNISALTE